MNYVVQLVFFRPSVNLNFEVYYKKCVMTNNTTFAPQLCAKK